MNDILLSNIKTIAEVFALVGVIAAGLGVAYGQFFGGRRKEASEQTIANTTLIQGLQEQIRGFEKLVERLRKEHKEEIEKVRTDNSRMTGELGELRGQLKEKENKLTEYKEIFQGRNPQIEDTLKIIADFMKTLKPVMEKISDHFDKEHKVV